MNYPLIAKIIFNLLKIILASFSQLCFDALHGYPQAEWSDTAPASISPLPGTYCSASQEPTSPTQGPEHPTAPLTLPQPYYSLAVVWDLVRPFLQVPPQPLLSSL